MAQANPLTRTRGSRDVLAGTAALRAAVGDIVAHANRTIVILTPNLEPDVYEHADFLDTLKRFVLSKSFARIRVLITQPERTMKNGNQLVRMGQRLSSYIEFRQLPAHLQPVAEAFCIADATAIVYRPDVSSNEGIVETRSQDLAKRCLTEFERLWQAS
jgi:hypothetical protein